MGASFGGGSNQNQGQQSGTFNNQGQNTGLTVGATNGQTQQVGTNVGQNTGSFTNTVIAPEGYQQAWGGMNPSGQLDTVRAMQLGAANGASGYGQTFTTAQLQQMYPSLYRSTPDVAAGTVAAGTGASYANSYTPFANDVRTAALADFDAGAANGLNALRAQNAGAFANKRTGVAEGQMLADAARGRGTLSAGLGQNLFNTSVGFGQQDASRAAAVQAANADRDLQAQQFNRGMGQRQAEFDVGAAYQGQAGRNAAVGNLGNTIGQQYGLGFNWLNSGTPLIGQAGTQSGTQYGANANSGNTSGSTLGFSLNDILNSGQTQGTSSGSGRQKGGGVSGVIPFPGG